MMAETVEEVRSTMAATTCEPAFALVDEESALVDHTVSRLATYPQHKP